MNFARICYGLAPIYGGTGFALWLGLGDWTGLILIAFGGALLGAWHNREKQ